MYGVEAAFGRTFAPDEDELGKDHVIVLSHRLWSSQFCSDPALVGKTGDTRLEPYTVIGVLPKGRRVRCGAARSSGGPWRSKQPNARATSTG